MPGPPARNGGAAAERADLEQLAATFGIEASYLDMRGERKRANPETLRAILRTFQMDAGSPRKVQAALREQRRQAEVLEPVLVLWNNQRPRLKLPPTLLSGSKIVKGVIHLEDGQRRTFEFRPEQLRANGSGAARELPTGPLPAGYHELELQWNSTRHDTLLISAPTRTFSPHSPKKRWGVFVPMYALHSSDSWGAGNFCDWQQLVNWVAKSGGGVVGTLPLLAAFLEKDFCEPSPYSPASRLFWNEFYVDIEKIPELSRCGVARTLVRSMKFREQLVALREKKVIDYAAEMRLRRQVLELLADCLFKDTSSRRIEFETFAEQKQLLHAYAAFRATGELQGNGWRQWPRHLRDGPLLPERDFSWKNYRYHLYAQWIVQEQLSWLVEHCRESRIDFYLDLPLGVHPDGFDVWRYRSAFAAGMGAGAPPDPVFNKGQNWGFSPLHPQAIRKQRYDYVRQYLQFQMQHTGILRLDHVMGLHRLYWVPEGFPASQGAYVRYKPEEWYAILCLESARSRTMLVGENLGTVPPEVNEQMQRHSLRKMFVLQYEQQGGDGNVAPRPPRESVASLNTHDMPPFAAFLKGDDITDRAKLGLLSRSEAARERTMRRKVIAALERFLDGAGFAAEKKGDEAALFSACARWLADGDEELLLLNLEDLWQETNPQNVPGTCAERPNWKRKTKLTLDDIKGSPKFRGLLREVSRLRSLGKTPRVEKAPMS